MAFVHLFASFLDIAANCVIPLIYVFNCFFLQAKLMENSHAWLGASTSATLAGKLNIFTK